MSVNVVERSQGESPALFSCEVVADQPEISKKRIDTLAISYGRGAGRRVETLNILFNAIARSLAPPEDLTRITIETQRDELSAFGACQEQFSPNYDWRGMPLRQRHFPHNIFMRAKLNGESRRLRHSRSLWATELRPVAGQEFERQRARYEPKQTDAQPLLE